MKKLKKLTLKKEVISNLDGNEMNQVKGGYGSVIICGSEIDWTCKLVILCQSVGGTENCPDPDPAPAPKCETFPCTTDPCGKSNKNTSGLPGCNQSNVCWPY